MKSIKASKYKLTNKTFENIQGLMAARISNEKSKTTEEENLNES